MKTKGLSLIKTADRIFHNILSACGYYHVKQTLIPNLGQSCIAPASRIPNRPDINFQEHINPSSVFSAATCSIPEKSKTDKSHMPKEAPLNHCTNSIVNNFNNQLSIILSTANILNKKTSDDDNLTKYIERLISASKRSAEYASQLMTALNQENKCLESINIHSLIMELDYLLQCNNEANISIHKKLWAEQHIVSGYPLPLKNALLNLLYHRTSSMPYGGILSCWTENISLSNTDHNECEELPPGDYISITVTDTGIGLKKQKDQPFDPETPTSNSDQYLKDILQVFKRHHGHVSIVPASDAVFSFTAYLPLIESSNSPTNKHNNYVTA